MLAVVVVWMFASFIYFKVAFDLGFTYRSISIFAAFLLALVFGSLVFATSGIYSLRLLRYNWTPGTVSASTGTLIKATILPFFVIWITFSCLSGIIIYGFSKDLSRGIEFFRITNYRGDIREEIIIYWLITLIPVLIHYALCIFTTKMNTKVRMVDN
jgi:hypothetical protein